MGLNRTTYYYQPVPESAFNLHLMRLIDEQYLRTPFYGVPKMTAYLNRKPGYQVNHKRVQRLMRLMGLQAIYPKRRTSVPAKGHKVYPFLLRNLAITRPNQVWSTDGRPFGRLINTSLDVTHHQGWVSSPWRFRGPSYSELVSFQGT